MIGTIVGNYRVIRELGQGGMGAVYEGVDVMVERPVAIKMLRAEIARNPEVIERFRVEAVTLARLNHPCIATLYSFFREGENYYMVMEFVRGETLENLMRRSGRLAPQYVAEILTQTLDGMEHADAMGVLHRDIKPANIMITDNGRVKVTDFGIARILGSSRMTRDGRIIGTLEYLAPERIRGEEADIRSDLYSVGIVMYEAISGQLPFTANTDYDLMQAHLNQPPPALQNTGFKYPPWVNDLLIKALAKSRDQRFRSAEEFRNALIAGTGTPAAVARTGTMPTRLDPTSISATAQQPIDPTLASKELPLKWIGLAACATIVFAGLFLAIHHRRSAQEQAMQTAASLPQTTQAIRQPLVVAQPPKPAEPASSGDLVPIEIFQTKPASELPREQIKISPKERGTKGDPKGSGIPDMGSRPEAPPAGEPPRTTPVSLNPPLSLVASEPPKPVESATVPKAEPPASASTSTGAKSLHEVRKIFVEKMPGQLDEFIKSEIEKQLWGRVRVVSRKEEADAVLQGEVVENLGDTGSKVTGGYLGMKDDNIGSATLTDLKGSTVLWRAEAGDKSPILGIVKKGGPKKIAERLVNNLRRKLEY